LKSPRYILENCYDLVEFIRI